jgi:hypothetical protein
MATLPSNFERISNILAYEERLKSFKGMIYKPEQIPQLSDDLPSEDEIHLLFSVIGLNKLSETCKSKIPSITI